MPISIRDAREHNLKGIDVRIGDGLTVVTGVSGSGKTSLVFDTVYHEARRRFLEAFSPTPSRNRLTPARVRNITGLGPTIAVGQDLLNRNPNSNLASAAGLHPFFRILFTRFGLRKCVHCGTRSIVFSKDEIVQEIIALGESQSIRILVPLLKGTRGSHKTLLEQLAAKLPDLKILVDKEIWAGKTLAAQDPHDITLDFGTFGPGITSKQAREVSQWAWDLGVFSIQAITTEETHEWSRAPVCVVCGRSIHPLESKHFHEACPNCQGKGCDACQQTGLLPRAVHVEWAGLSLPDLLTHSVQEAKKIFQTHTLPPSSNRLRMEIEKRLNALIRVGLGYVNLDRASPSLSRGESQRVRLAVALTSDLEDIVHILDEPTIGQHPADVRQLLPAFRDLGGPVIYVEHDRIAATAADEAIDLGPGAGEKGGKTVFQGSLLDLWDSDTCTGRFFSLRERVEIPSHRPPPAEFLVIQQASLRNLQKLDIRIPLERLTVVTGVSGSGKTTLVRDVLAATLEEQHPIGCTGIKGPKLKVVTVTQDPIGRNPRSNPATYTNLATTIRDYFASFSLLSASHFSFNTNEGACPTCEGMGAIEVKMHYLPSTWIGCPDCGGQRFNEEVLSVRVPFGERKLNIAEFLELSVSEVLPLIETMKNLPTTRRRTVLKILQALKDIGLGYIALGQPSPTLSGGEAQRIKLAKYLGGKGLSKALLLLDEPSTGLHPHDIHGLLVVLDRLTRAGATTVVIEHNTDIIRSADWIIDLGPGAGPQGGELIYEGTLEGFPADKYSITANELRRESAFSPDQILHRAVPDRVNRNIRIVNARMHNLKGIDVVFPKGRFTVVTGVSGSGKSTLVTDILEREARRRYLETLSLYERHGTHEDAEAIVDAVQGLGVTASITPERKLHFSVTQRSTVGTVTEITHHLAVLLSLEGVRNCPKCGELMTRQNGKFACEACAVKFPIPGPRMFDPSSYGAACLKCHGMGVLHIPNVEKLIVHPEKPLCKGAMHSPGFFPKGYLCKPYNGGYYIVRAIAERHGWDPELTPWNQMTPEQQEVFLHGDPLPIQVVSENRKGWKGTRTVIFRGFYGWIGEWDVGGTYTDTITCPECLGAKLRPDYLAVTLSGYRIHELSTMSLVKLYTILENLGSFSHSNDWAKFSLDISRKRLDFLIRVGLGYISLDRRSPTLSAGEAQRIRLAGLLGSELTSLTVLLDEPTRGLHPSEVDGLTSALTELRDLGNTVIVVEHDPNLVRRADYVVELGPGPGIQGGRILGSGTPQEISKGEYPTSPWLRGTAVMPILPHRRKAKKWIEIQGATGNNLQDISIKIPRGIFVGVCGVSGSGKSTLVIDTLGRALAPKKQTTSVAYEDFEPEPFESLKGFPKKVVIIDQVKKGIVSPFAYLRLRKPLLKIFAQSPDALERGLDEKVFKTRCSTCKGRGTIKLDMAFLPAVYEECETCGGSGHRLEVNEIRVEGKTLPEIYQMTAQEVYDLFAGYEDISRPLEMLLEVGLNYLVLRQPGHALSGGEVQRLKIAGELLKKTTRETLFILDEPTLGLHMNDVSRLVTFLHRLVDEGNSIIVIEHDPHLLAACDWIVELGPGGGIEGGHVVAEGTPEQIAETSTPTALYLKAILDKGGNGS